MRLIESHNSRAFDVLLNRGLLEETILSVYCISRRRVAQRVVVAGTTRIMTKLKDSLMKDQTTLIVASPATRIDPAGRRIDKQATSLLDQIVCLTLANKLGSTTKTTMNNDVNNNSKSF